jgi:hypothetical protein
MMRRVANGKGIDHEQCQTSQCGYDSVGSDRNPGLCTAGCRRSRHAGVLSEPGCWIPWRHASERHGIDTQQRVCERARKAHFFEALRERSQDVTGRANKSVPIHSKGGPMDRLFY